MQSINRAEALDRVVALSEHEAEGAIVVCAGVGLGRTLLFENAHQHSRCDSVIVRVNRAETEFPLSGLSLFLGNLGDTRLASFAGQFSLHSTESRSLYDAAGQLLKLLRGLSLAPLLVLIDDADQMDAESQAILGYMSSRLNATNLRIAFSVETCEQRSPFAGLPSFQISPMSKGATHDLIDSLSLHRTDAGTRHIISVAAQGVPLSAYEITESLSPRQLLGREPLILPFRAGVRMRGVASQPLTNLDDNALQVVNALSSAAFTPIDAFRGELECETDTRSDDSSRADTIENLLAARIISTDGQMLSLVDPALRSVAYWSMPANSRRILHERLAASLRDSDPRLAVWHESWGSSTGPFCVRLMDAAAELAGMGLPTAAVEFAERALLLNRRERVAMPGVFALALAFLRDGELELAVRYSRLATDSPANARRMPRLVRIGIYAQFLLSESIADEDQNFDDDAVRHGDRLEQALLYSTLALVTSERSEDVQARSWLARSVRLSPEVSGHPFHIGVVAVVRARFGGSSSAEAELALVPTPEGPWNLESQMLEARVLSLRERHASARQVYSRLIERLGHATGCLTEFARTFAADNDIVAGDFTAARMHIEQLSGNYPVLEFRRLLLKIWSLESVGRGAETAKLVEECKDAARRSGNPVVVTRLAAQRGSFALMRGAFDEALEHLNYAQRSATHLPSPQNVLFRADLIEALALSGSDVRARVEFSHLQRAAEFIPSRMADLLVARSRAIVATDASCLERFTEALDLFRPSDSPFERGRTLLSSANALDRVLGPGAGDARRDEAREAFVACGAFGWVDQVEKHPHRPPVALRVAAAGSPVFATSFTDDESRILELLRSGYRNKEIAAELFVSLRTVEVRLTQIYRKTGSRSRAEVLARMLLFDPATDFGRPPSSATPSA